MKVYMKNQSVSIVSITVKSKGMKNLAQPLQHNNAAVKFTMGSLFQLSYKSPDCSKGNHNQCKCNLDVCNMVFKDSKFCHGLFNSASIFEAMYNIRILWRQLNVNATRLVIANIVINHPADRLIQNSEMIFKLVSDTWTLIPATVPSTYEIFMRQLRLAEI
ncbi:hypothetical protein A3I56_01815 [Candidatus Roizmanbacteria bacterium RIFCSPLOWO2_02_FULL_43_10]|uniref:Uncharacterized protein n=2 Tax=Candidatus Roizmaniibacteriota TaxID=1752723 RepID=A0A1F7K0D5_9BACT|nr:MAG: hypothetical protein A3F32_02975 [Candidatus Roizmanbacteria bacterium RIFCSPHIGHO2_12_FULL_42_10]OGK61334.1 MAG: hypothetical protein A3I56_01815 [Candidatus Roizmanbacteria bacterium RIFCSPLOWO2_02_FULL_43_10]